MSVLMVFTGFVGHCCSCLTNNNVVRVVRVAHMRLIILNSDDGTK